MNLKRSITYFMCLILLSGSMATGCSNKGDKTVDSSNQIMNKQELQEDSVSKAAEQSSEVASEDDLPWKLVSESSVKTAVYYAGFLNESIGVTVGYDGAISYTEDGGKNWSQSSNESACRYGLDIYDESFIVSSGNSGVNLVSIDKGKSWSGLTDFPLKDRSSYNKFLSVLDTKNIYIGSKQSLGVSNDGGVTWKELKLPEKCTNIAGMYFLTPEIGYLMDKDGTLVKTNDSCETWTAQTIDLSGEKIANSTMPSVAINFQDEDHGTIVYATQSFKLSCIKTEDGGSTWESIEMPKVSCLAPYISRDGQYLTLSSATKKICLYKF
jgi:photosystem II stability/assembly factor-like uncharacterized protein